jgi:hypothetical protein
MKNVETNRFQQKNPEEISFKGASLTEKPPKIEAKERTSERTDVRTPERTNVPKKEIQIVESEAVNVYTIEVPKERRKIRHPFDIFEDQLEGLKKIQMAKRETGGAKEVLTLGDMAREALDDFIHSKTKRSANIKLMFEQDKQEAQSVRTDERTDEKPPNG